LNCLLESQATKKLLCVISSEARNLFFDPENEISPRFVVTERAERVEVLVEMTSKTEFISNLVKPVVKKYRRITH
jgi:hypothetical protein